MVGMLTYGSGKSALPPSVPFYAPLSRHEFLLFLPFFRRRLLERLLALLPAGKPLLERLVIVVRLVLAVG
jgi:hypothetical protein